MLQGGAVDDALRWRYVAEFLEEYRHEPPLERLVLLTVEPAPTGDVRWDVFLAALAEHVAARDDRAAPPWAHGRRLEVFWFPFNTAAARVDAVVHAPASFRSRGIFVAPGGDPSAAVSFTHPGLRVSTASPEHLLAMKALAARRRDTDDLRLLVDQLGLRSSAEVVAVCARVIPDEPLRERALLAVQDLFGEGPSGR